MKSDSRLYSRAIEIVKTEGVHGLWCRGWEKLRYNARRSTFRPYVIKKFICGEAIDFLIADLCAQGWYDRVHEWPELMWLKAHVVDANDIVVDCGAHHGLTTILFARWASAGKVFGYEAHPRNAAIAKKNVSLNHLINAEIRQFAVGKSVGIAQITDHSNSSMLTDQDSDGVDVPMVTLDSEFRTKAPTFLKIDVEGQELNVLKGATSILQNRPKLDIEIHCTMHKDPIAEVGEILDIISVKKYQAFIQLEVDGPINRFDSGEHTIKNICQSEVVHLFCLPQ